jgi:hypothetical protein
VTKYIKNCKEHDNASNLDLCLECDEGFYLATPDSCLARTADSKRYLNCDQKDPQNDYCLKCTQNFIFSESNFECLEAPPFCIRYIHDNDPAAVAPFHKCDACAELYYLEPQTKVCNQIPVANCRTYNSTITKCTHCLPKFYLETLDSGEVVCSPHDADQFPTCQIFSPDVKNRCIYCGQGCNIFENKSQCVRRDKTDLCEWYDQKGENCVACFDGFELSPQLDCRMLDTRKNCLSGTGDYCYKCQYGYQRLFSGANLNSGYCLRNENWVEKNCDSVTGKGIF